MKIKFIFFISLIFTLIVGNLCQDNVQDLREHIDAYCEEPDKKTYDKITMAYISTENTKGMDVALKYLAKIDIVAPKWFAIKAEILREKFNAKVFSFLIAF